MPASGTHSRGGKELEDADHASLRGDLPREAEREVDSKMGDHSQRHFSAADPLHNLHNGAGPDSSETDQSVRHEKETLSKLHGYHSHPQPFNAVPFDPGLLLHFVAHDTQR